MGSAHLLSLLQHRVDVRDDEARREALEHALEQRRVAHAVLGHLVVRELVQQRHQPEARALGRPHGGQPGVQAGEGAQREPERAAAIEAVDLAPALAARQQRRLVEEVDGLPRARAHHVREVAHQGAEGLRHPPEALLLDVVHQLLVLLLLAAAAHRAVEVDGRAGRRAPPEHEVEVVGLAPAQGKARDGGGGREKGEIR